jgi:hypothetical protein
MCLACLVLILWGAILVIGVRCVTWPLERQPVFWASKHFLFGIHCAVQTFI